MSTKTGKEIVNGLLENMTVGEQTLIEVSKEMIGKDNKITFAVERRQLQPEQVKPPIKAESPMRCHVFNDAVGFVEYLKKYKTTNTVVLVDVVNKMAYATLDEKAENGFERITLIPVTHPLFRPWEMLLADNPKDLKKFAEFLSVNRKGITDPNSKELISLLSQVKVSKEMTLQTGFGKHCLNSISCKMDIMGEKKDQLIELPESIKVRVPLFVGTPPIDFEVDLTISTNDADIVVVRCSSADLVEAALDAFNIMIEAFNELPEMVVAYGEPRIEGWEYLD